MNQSEIIKRMSDQEITKSIVYTQLFILTISIILSFILFDQFRDWFNYFKWDRKEIFYYGLIPGLFIVLIDLVLMDIFPKRYFDDGGINERIFKNRSFGGILNITILIAISEELLFRGVIQTTFGVVFASILFALVHVRYLKKPVLLTVIVLISFYFGFLFERTENLLVTITAHFVVDFLLGIIIRYRK